MAAGAGDADGRPKLTTPAGHLATDQGVGIKAGWLPPPGHWSVYVLCAAPWSGENGGP